MNLMRCVIALLFAWVAMMPLSHVASAQSGVAYSYVANTSPPDAFLALKTFPSINSPRIMAMANGTRLEVLLRRTDGWWYVKVSPTGEEGWAYSGRDAKAYIHCCAEAGGAQVAREPVAREIADFSCEQLWFSRNSIYKEAGYCFKTPRAISAFGNAGCRYDDVEAVQLTPENKNFVQVIQRTERANHCTL